jgi:drug efflux transport system ATP-binding protein
MNQVRVQRLSKTFPKATSPALDSIDLEVGEGKILGLVGPDASGKTTLMRLLAGLLLPTSGQIEVGSFDTVRQTDALHSVIGYMPQQFGLYDELSVEQNLSLYADLRGVVGERRKEKFAQLLSFTNLTSFQGRLARNLSGGMRQKLGLACALIGDPKVLLLDEPTTGVDPISRRELWKIVGVLLEEGITVIWSTGYLDEAERCDAVLLLNDGKQLFSGSPAELTARVEGRVYSIAGALKNRPLLTRLLNREDVVDGVLQGSHIRVVMQEELPPEVEEPARVERAAPRFEDAFIDILEGKITGYSGLADRIAPLPMDGGRKREVIEVEGLTKHFGKFTAVDGVSFSVHQGEIFGLLGPNGAGKSTLFRMMCGLLAPSAGRAFIADLDLQTAPSRGRAKIGYVAQKFSLYRDLSVRQNLNFFGGIYNLSWGERRKAVEQMVDIFKLEKFLNASVERLPLGYKQRLALACAVIHRPPVLFLDEPTAGVDPVTRREFWTHINGLVQKGVTIMVTTHFMDEAAYCDRIGLVYNSKLIVVDTPDALAARAKSSSRPHPTLEDAFVQLVQEQHAEP